MNELVSVIVPIYKVEKYLSRCIDSILNQTYKNLEIILVNDGSPDKCGEICNQYKSCDNRIIVVNKKNGGLSDARNFGIEVARGKYISFVDSDDWIAPEYIEKLYHLLNETHADISVVNFIKTSTERIKLEGSTSIVQEFSNIEALEELTGRLYMQMVVAWGKLYKSYLFNGVRFPLGRIHEDEFTTYKLIYKSKKVTVSNERLLYYWQREDSIMGSGFNIKHRLDLLDAFEEREKFYRSNRLYNLSNKTLRTIFTIYMDTFNKNNGIDHKVCNTEIKKRYNRFKILIRKSKQAKSFKIFYEMYFIFPSIMKFVYRSYMSYKNKTNTNST